MLRFSCQLVNAVKLRQVQDILDNEAQFICYLNRLLEKLLSLSKGKEECSLDIMNQEPTHVGLKDTYSQQLKTGDWLLLLEECLGLQALAHVLLTVMCVWQECFS